MNNEVAKTKKLSRRELEVLNLLKKGFKNKNIAKSLNINEKTVSTYLMRIKNKLGVNADTNTYMIVHYAELIGLFKRQGNIKKEGDNKSYKVKWEIELDAPNELEAALLAQQIQQDVNSLAGNFTATEIGTCNPVEVDLTE